MVGICPVDDDGNAAAKEAKHERSEPKAAVSAPPPTPAMTQVPGEWVTAFAALTDKDKMKAMYTHLRNSQVAEPSKTEVLTVWAKRSKESVK
jgi:hypothetical protein